MLVNLVHDIHLEIWNNEEINKYRDEMEECIRQGDIEGFEELIIKYSQLVQELTLQADKQLN